MYFDQLLGAGRTRKLVKTFFQPFFNLFCSFQSFFSDFTAEITKTSKNEQKNVFLSTPQSWSTCKSWLTPWGGTSNLSFFCWFLNCNLIEQYSMCQPIHRLLCKDRSTFDNQWTSKISHWPFTFRFCWRLEYFNLDYNMSLWIVCQINKRSEVLEIIFEEFNLDYIIE